MQPQPRSQTQGRTVLYCISPGRKGIRVLAPADLDQGANSRNPGAVLGKSGLRALAIVKAHPPGSKSYMVKICQVAARSQAASSGVGGSGGRPCLGTSEWAQLRCTGRTGPSTSPSQSPTQSQCSGSQHMSPWRCPAAPPQTLSDSQTHLEKKGLHWSPPQGQRLCPAPLKLRQNMTVDPLSPAPR